jgi:4-carboxymuconolactone decarboxylase
MDAATDVKSGEPASAADLRRLFWEHPFADSWSRTALDNRSRSLVTVGIAAALGMERELRNHVAGALMLGITPDELVDTMIHVGVYAGVPRGSSAWTVASEVIVAASEREEARRRAAAMSTDRMPNGQA